ncbi:ATP-binding protein [Microlunatus parietis]|uniref:AAA-like domain-containing protein n=1 Tax=Microlunatus parietis TaxID=682979 RepID=A0A7Y9LE87_9ACTN|nr:ATP-binding protein [Microlunatus parietis]NYE74687.1 hypothetical protein [Microlunatus parietis]
MANRNQRRGATLNQLSTKPTYYTTLGPTYPGGRCRSSMDGSVWLYRSVPLKPVVDARDDKAAMDAMTPLFRAYVELAGLVDASSNRRYTARSSYRRTHALLLNIQENFHLPWTHPLGAYLNKGFGEEPIDNRLLLFGVQLNDKVGGGGGFRDRIDSLAAFFKDGLIPLADFDEDYARVDAALARCGLIVPRPEQLKLADAYWNLGETPATPRLNHLEHMHVFHSPDSMRIAEIVGTENCEALEAVPGQSAVTYASVTEFDFDFDSPTDPVAHWVSTVIDEGAIAVSVRGLVEPAKMTRNQLRTQRKRFIRDIEDRRKQGQLSRSEQDEMLMKLGQVEDHYGKGGANPSLIDASALVAFSGIKSLDTFNSASNPIRLAPMTLLQPGAMAETWLCSNVRANPKLHDIPVQVIAASGMTSLSFVGDKDGALVGFTERDRQPAWLSPKAASAKDKLPLFLCAASTGSGKTMLLLNLADQWARGGESGVIIDPKQGSDHSAVVEACGGQTIRLDDIRSADGIFDPIRFSASTEVGVELASSMLLSINVWGDSSAKARVEQPLGEALRYGVEQGATCIGEALAIADRELDHLPEDMIRRVLSEARNSATFSALCGTDPQSQALTVAEGITLIMVGDNHLNVPLAGQAPDGLGQRTALALVRMMVFGSAAALRSRGGGFVSLDEAWMFLGAGAAEVERLGRLARSQRVLPLLFTQRVTDALEAGLKGYISRLAIGPLEDEDEAIAACRIAGLNPDRYKARIMLPGTLGGDSHTGEQPNWDSMHALKSPRNSQVLRGSIFIYQDLDSRAVPTEIRLTDEFHRLASTNPEDVEARKRERAETLGQGSERLFA